MFTKTLGYLLSVINDLKIILLSLNLPQAVNSFAFILDQL